MSAWYVYVLKCSDNSLYTGVTTDVERRLKEHNSSKKGAKYTRSRRPVDIVFFSIFKDRSSALKFESRFKRFSRDKKLEYISESKEAEVGDIVCCKTFAGPIVHSKLLKREIVPKNGKWGGYSGWFGTSVYDSDNEKLSKAGVPKSDVGKDEHWIFDFHILHVKKRKKEKIAEANKQPKRSGRRRIVR
tara:strand:+ start:1326 stop:1889 length:564 start_codon:yes stop_codon:yes gene_type:complete